jgi:hypothetical protein
MTNKALEEAIYEFGAVMYQIGRYETDGKDTTKEYNKLVKQKETLKEAFEDHFNSNNKIGKTLSLF